jgi:hypothetical protein
MGKFTSPVKHHNSNFNIPEGASKNAVQFPSHAVDTPKILTLRQFKITAPNSRSSGVVTLQLNTDNVFLYFVIRISLSLLSYCNDSQAYKIGKQAATGLKSHLKFTVLRTIEIISRDTRNNKTGRATSQSVITIAHTIGLLTIYGIKKHKKKITCNNLV